MIQDKKMHDRMMQYKKRAIRFIFPVALLATLLSGCATPPPMDYSALIDAKPRSIVVIPPLNNSIEVNAEYTFLSTISKPLAEKGYYVFPVAMVDRMFKENGLPTSAEMNQIPLEKIRDIIGADAVLYTRIEQWGQKYNVLSSNAVTEASLTLVDTRTGTELWSASAYAQKSSNDGNQNGLIGMLVGALIQQVAGSINDATPQLSRQANNSAIFNQRRGLLDGPYAPQKEAPKEQAPN